MRIFKLGQNSDALRNLDLIVLATVYHVATNDKSPAGTFTTHPTSCRLYNTQSSLSVRLNHLASRS